MWAVFPDASMPILQLARAAQLQMATPHGRPQDFYQRVAELPVFIEVDHMPRDVVPALPRQREVDDQRHGHCRAAKRRRAVGHPDVGIREFAEFVELHSLHT